jgi:hypothetical protein
MKRKLRKMDINIGHSGYYALKSYGINIPGGIPGQKQSNNPA